MSRSVNRCDGSAIERSSLIGMEMGPLKINDGHAAVVRSHPAAVLSIVLASYLMIVLDISGALTAGSVILVMAFIVVLTMIVRPTLRRSSRHGAHHGPRGHTSRVDPLEHKGNFK